MTPLFPFLGLVAGLFNPAVAAQLTAFILRLQGIQSLDFVLNLIDSVTPRLVLGMQFNGVIRIRLACLLVLGIFLCLVIVAVKLRLEC